MRLVAVARALEMIDRALTKRSLAGTMRAGLFAGTGATFWGL